MIDRLVTLILVIVIILSTLFAASFSYMLLEEVIRSTFQ
jgi:CHASE1-domain containing sensor protein